MKIKQYFLYGLTSATLLILGSQNDANASIKKQFESRNSCSWETSTYQSEPILSEVYPGDPDAFYYTNRYCISGDKRVIKYTDRYKKYNNNQYSEFVQKGFIGESEASFDDTWIQTEYAIEGNALVKYSCRNANAYDCGSGKVEKEVLGTKINTNENYTGGSSSKQRNGIHTERFNNGDSYAGNFKNGKQDGKGTYTWSNGNKYEGDWKNGNRTGKGTFTWADGDKYEGDYVDDKRTGKGTYFWSNGDKYEGDWKNSKRTGKGTLTWADGRKYVGDFVDGKLEGEGIFTYANGKILEGKFENGNLVESYKLSGSTNTIPTNMNSSNDSTFQKPNLQNLENEVKGMFKNMFN